MKKLWTLLSGSKTTISMIGLLIINGVTAFFPSALTPDQANVLENAVLILGGIGIIHKGVKNETVNNAIKRATKK